MDGTFNGFTLVEEELFSEQLLEIGHIRDVDAALRILGNALSENPTAFPIVPGTEKLRLAKTISYERNGRTIPPLRVWFSFEDSQFVVLRSIEVIEEI